MRYIEYAYLIAALAVAVFIGVNYKNMNTTQVVMTGLAAGIAAFMYSFRRAQRVAFEAKEQEELEELRKKADDDPEV